VSGTSTNPPHRRAGEVAGRARRHQAIRGFMIAPSHDKMTDLFKKIVVLMNNLNSFDAGFM
jgi:hypothetical protein